MYKEEKKNKAAELKSYRSVECLESSGREANNNTTCIYKYINIGRYEMCAADE